MLYYVRRQGIAMSVREGFSRPATSAGSGNTVYSLILASQYHLSFKQERNKIQALLDSVTI